jgi:hypothetical protein
VSRERERERAICSRIEGTQVSRAIWPRLHAVPRTQRGTAHRRSVAAVGLQESLAATTERLSASSRHWLDGNEMPGGPGLANQ